MKRLRKSALGAGLAVALAVAPHRATAAEPLPPVMQGVLFKKIFAYNRAFEGRARLKVLVVGENGAKAEGLVRAFAQSGLEAAVVSPAAAAQAEGEVAAVYVSAESAGVVEAYCRRQQILTISGDPSLAESGQAAVALGQRGDGKPEIIVNLKRMAIEGQRFSADLLAYARVVR